MRRLEHQNIVKLKYFFYSTGDKVYALFHILIDFAFVFISVFVIFRKKKYS